MLQRAFRISAVVSLLAAMLAAFVVTQADAPGNRYFAGVWSRADKPVAEGQATRTWMWGPEASGPLLLEEYAESPDQRRVVQYFDKSRMEISEPDENPDATWYVTNGLLATELITGRRQVGDNEFEQHEPAEVNVAGDPDDEEAPTYATFTGLLDQPATPTGERITHLLSRDGSVTEDDRLASYDVRAATHVADTDHTVAAPFWTFMTSSGTVYEAGAFVTDALFPDPFYATGFPITEAYWAVVTVGGSPHDVLIQCFQRRCLTYTPGNPPGFETEAGNVGKHYYAWRYAADEPVVPPTPTVGVPSSATWRQLQPASGSPGARADHTLVANADGSHVYLFGGRSGDGALGDLWAYDVNANSWLLLASDGPGARFGHNAAFDSTNNRLVIFGGQGESGFFSDVWTWDVSSGGWSLLAENGAGPLDRYGAGGAYDPAANELFISHGFTSDGRFDDTWSFGVDSGSWTDFSPADEIRPEPRCLTRTVVDSERNRLLLFGGQSNSSPFLGDLWSFDLASRTWTQLGTEGPSARNLYAAVTRSDASQLVLFGGNAGGSNSSELWVLDLTTDSWTLVDSTGPARHSHDAVWLPGRNVMLVFGGNAGDELNDLWEVTLT